MIVVSGSKGNYLKLQISLISPEKNRFFESESGRNAKQAVGLVAANIQNYRRKYGNILSDYYTHHVSIKSSVFNNSMYVARSSDPMLLPVGSVSSGASLSSLIKSVVNNCGLSTSLLY